MGFGQCFKLLATTGSNLKSEKVAIEELSSGKDAHRPKGGAATDGNKPNLPINTQEKPNISGHISQFRFNRDNSDCQTAASLRKRITSPTMDRRDFHLLALYEFRLGHESADAARNLRTTFGENAPDERTVRERFARFLAGDEDVEDAEFYHNRILVTVWWSTAGLLHYNFMRPGQGATTGTFIEELEQVHQKIETQQPAPSTRKQPVLLYDSSRRHIEKSTLQKLNQLGVELLPHPQHSPDLLPTEFHFFPAFEKSIKDRRFHDEDEVKDAFKEFLNSVDDDFYKDGINALVSRWERCIEHNGAYI
ncbi:hypothetical protein OESDEN_09175 [Oesophagostomum dentatum]|uniref:Mos1 transposase HTH domain-containing protein n=1 Tax=Oesophagostomum dentatum TaxID=61180 RepID=A0A0B1T484_OESDE|nr:hypothetical protein OESDEN_09175 [Oesophagostomum dentatum]